MSEQLTARQQILLWDLVSRGGSALQKDIRPEIKPADREPLRKAGAILVSKEKNGSLRLEIGEERCWDLLDARPPTLQGTSGSKYDRLVLQFVLERMSLFAKRNRVGLAQVVAGKEIVGRDEEMTHNDTSSNSGGEVSVEKQIEIAFSAIAGRPAVNQVRLRALRDRLKHVPKDELDRVLREMRENSRASFSRLSNPPDIAAEEGAALRIKDQTFHTIWIEA